MELLFDSGKVFFRDAPCRCSRAVRMVHAGWWLSSTAIGTYGSCQVVALVLGVHSQLREMIKYINARTAQYWRAQQHQATGQRVATRAHKRIQYSYSGCSISFVHVRSSSFLISANPKYNIANEVALNQGGSNGISLQYSHHHQQYEALLCGEQADTLHTQARESPTNEQQAHIHRSLPRSLNRISESQTHKRRPSSLWL